jgi:hypothetical protein
MQTMPQAFITGVLNGRIQERFHDPASSRGGEKT